MRLAASPLAVPYLLNPAGIAALVMISAEICDLNLYLKILLGRTAALFAFDNLVFHRLSRPGRSVNRKGC
jgi:hypothetical protein